MQYQTGDVHTHVLLIYWVWSFFREQLPAPNPAMHHTRRGWQSPALRFRKLLQTLWEFQPRLLLPKIHYRIKFFAVRHCFFLPYNPILQSSRCFVRFADIPHNLTEYRRWPVFLKSLHRKAFFVLYFVG